MILLAFNYFKFPSLIALDVANLHRTPALRTLLKKNNLTSSMIPAGCYSIMENIDLVVNF